MGFSKLILLDIGTSAIRYAAYDEKQTHSFPNVIIINEGMNKVSSWGAEAKSWLGRIPKGMYARYPVSQGKVVAVRALDFLVDKIAGQLGQNTLTPKHVFLVTQIENTDLQRQVITSICQRAGFNEVSFITQNMALALGVGLPITDFKATALLRLGAGSADFCIYAGGGYIFKREFKATFEWGAGDQDIEKLSSLKVQWLKDLARDIAAVLSKLDSQALEDIKRNGITVGGGVAQLKGLGKLFTQSLNVPVHVNHNEFSVLEGLRYFAEKGENLDLDTELE